MVTSNAAPCLFLSHSGADTDAARQLKRRLLDSPDARAARLTIWLDKDDLGAGIGWQAQIEKAINEKATAFAVHLGAKGVVNWVDSEVRLALSRAAGAADYAFIPILSRECAGAAALPPFAQQYQGVRDPLNNPEEFAKLLRAVLGRSPSEKAVALENPFVGLKSMTEADAERVLRPQRGDCRARRQTQAAPADCSRCGQRCRQILARAGWVNPSLSRRQARGHGGPRAR